MIKQIFEFTNGFCKMIWYKPESLILNIVAAKNSNIVTNKVINTDKRWNTIVDKKLNAIVDKTINIMKNKNTVAKKQLNATVDKTVDTNKD